jgi:UDP-2-acetamido-3-amino-2,3-dideoxy-glucuronate N-acetyltransferase
MNKPEWKDPVYDDMGVTQWHWRVSHRENFILGKEVEIGSFTMIDAHSGVIIEDDVKIGFGCVILSYSSIDNRSGRVRLAKGCKVGANSVIMPGVEIGEGAIVGSNSLVNRNIPGGETWFGSPAKFYKKNDRS